jgi:NADPH:quinone reductase-like Zn-dependent oxidoreductase
MKAMVYEKFGPPEVLQYREIEKPKPNDHEVLIRIHAGTVTIEEPGWRAAPGFNGFFKPRNPVLGEEFAGEIEAVGECVTRFKPGEAVFGIDSYGAHAEYKCIAEDKALVHKPANVSYEQAATLPNGALTALPFLRDKGEIHRGDKVLIYGASGSVGTAAVQLARHFGAQVSGVCSTANLALVTSLGAEVAVDYTAEDFTQSGERYDIIFDTVGKLTFSHCKGSLTPDGIYLTTVPTLEILPHMLRRRKRSGKRARFMAAGLRSPAEKTVDLLFIKELVEAGELVAVIDRRYSLEELAEAHRYVAGGHKVGNVVITVDYEN